MGNGRLEWRKHPGHPKLQFYMEKVVFGDFGAVLGPNGRVGKGVRTTSKSKKISKFWFGPFLDLNRMYKLWVSSLLASKKSRAVR